MQEGFERELGASIREIKRPRFVFVDDFAVDQFGVAFDDVMAYSVFTHCYPDLARLGLTRIGAALAREVGREAAARAGQLARRELDRANQRVRAARRPAGLSACR